MEAAFGECRRSGDMLTCDVPVSNDLLNKGIVQRACEAFYFKPNF